MIRLAKSEDIYGLSKLLIEAFDLEYEINDILDMIEPFKNTFVYEISGEIVSTASAIPFVVGEKKGRYIYAVATDINYRGKGYAGEVLEYIKEYYKDTTDVLLLRPAEESLFDFYRRKGFKEEVYADVREIQFKGEEVPEMIDFDEYVKERSKYNAFSFSEKVMKYYFDNYNYCAFKGKDFLLLCGLSQNCCVFDEVYGNFENADMSFVNVGKMIAVVNGKSVYALASFYDEKFDINFRVPME